MPRLPRRRPHEGVALLLTLLLSTYSLVADSLSPAQGRAAAAQAATAHDSGLVDGKREQPDVNGRRVCEGPVDDHLHGRHALGLEGRRTRCKADELVARSHER